MHTTHTHTPTNRKQHTHTPHTHTPTPTNPHTCQQKATTTRRTRQGHMELRGDALHFKISRRTPQVHTNDNTSIGMMTRSRTSVVLCSAVWFSLV